MLRVESAGAVVVLGVAPVLIILADPHLHASARTWLQRFPASALPKAEKFYFGGAAGPLCV